MMEHNVLPRISIIIPCRNEAKFINGCLETLINNGYPKELLEIIVIDGMSDDGTREILAKNYLSGGIVRLVDNPKLIIPAALNLGIRAARFDIIVRADAHSGYRYDYLLNSVKGLLETGADVVGGTLIVTPRSPTLQAKTISLVYTTALGAGGATYRTGKVSTPVVADTAVFGCFRKSVFEKYGMYNESIIRSEDMDLMGRIRQGGGLIMTVPGVEAEYFVRSTLVEFFRHALLNGYWVTYPLLYTNLGNFRLRHFIPMLFCLYILTLAVGYVFDIPYIEIAALPGMGLYLLAVLYYAARLSWKAANPRLFVIVPFAYLALHLGYGMGSAYGLLGFLRGKIRRLCSNLHANAKIVE